MTALPNAPLVRAAVAEDWPQLIEMCKELYEESGQDDVGWDLVEHTVACGINRDGAMIGVIGPVGKVEGATCLVFASFWYSRKVFLEERFLYVRPDYRRSGN